MKRDASVAGPVPSLPRYIADACATLPLLGPLDAPWTITARAAELVRAALPTLGSEYERCGEVAVHRAAVVEPGAILRGPAIVSRDCLVAAHALLRGGVFLDAGVRIGPSCEVKASLVFRGSALAHLNYVGDSLIGAEVNLEAGAVIANRFNERADKRIAVLIEGRVVPTGVERFGALVGDGSRIGANAVTTPGTVLPPRSVVGRLALVDQVAEWERRRRRVRTRNGR